MNLLQKLRIPGAINVYSQMNWENKSYPKTPDKYGIRGIPTLMFFKAGKPVDKLTGLVPRSIIEDAIKKCLA